MSKDGSTEMNECEDALSYFSISFHNTLYLSGGSQHVLGPPMYDRDIPKFSKRAAGLKGGCTF